MNPAATAGTCSVCGNDLVQVKDGERVVRTYHPHNSLPEGFDCPALIPLSLDHLSLDIHEKYFTTKEDDAKLRESLNRMEKEA